MVVMNDPYLRRALPALLALSLLLSLFFVWRVPFGDNPDETAHRDYIRLIVEERGFVKFIERDKLPEDAPSRDEAHQPPLYYLLCAPVYEEINLLQPKGVKRIRIEVEGAEFD